MPGLGARLLTRDLITRNAFAEELVAERNGPEMLARIAIMKALNRHIAR
jgi:hypothetical protein